MLRKLLPFTAFSIFACTAAYAQESPTPKDTVERKVQTMIFTAPFERSYLGVQTVEISKENMTKFGLSAIRGVGIEKVVENSPAARAGLQTGDVIVHFEGEEVKSVLKLTRLLAEISPEQTAKITVLRGGSEREFIVTLGKREMLQAPMGNFRFENMPAIPALPRNPQTLQTVPLPPIGEGERNFFILRGANRQIGVGVSPLTKQLGDYFGIADGKGLLVNNVRENSPADKAGIKAGDIIVEAEGKEVKGMTDLIRAVNEKKEGDVSLTIVRDRNRQIIRVTPEISKDGSVRFEEFNNLFEPGQNQLKFQPQTPQLAPLYDGQMKFAPRIL